MSVKYMRKIGSNDIYIATEWLEKRGDMEYCDAINITIPPSVEKIAEELNVSVDNGTVLYGQQEIIVETDDVGEFGVKKKPGRPKKINV